MFYFRVCSTVIQQYAKHRLNMDLDLQSLFELHAHSCTHWLRPRKPPPPLHLGSYTRVLVSQDRRHLFVTPCCKGYVLKAGIVEQSIGARNRVGTGS
jgi:hypothetical protein